MSSVQEVSMSFEGNCCVIRWMQTMQLPEPKSDVVSSNIAILAAALPQQC